MFSATYKIYPEVGLVYYQIEGDAELSKMTAFYEEIYNDPLFSVDYKGVGDWRRVQRNMTRDEIVALSAYVKKRKLSNGHWVALVDSPIITALSQIYASIIEPQHPLDACCTVKRASEILEIDLSPYIEETNSSSWHSPVHK